MRVFAVASLLFLCAVPDIAQAATVVVLTDPMTLERRTMVVDPHGPDRILFCTLPPAVSGCRDVTPRRR